jgi:uncharacterized protein (DUF1800 family)
MHWGAGALIVLPIVIGCAASAGAGGGSTTREPPYQPPTAAVIAAREQTADQQVQHVLNRLAFGARPGDVAAVRTLGVDRWIDRQLHPERLADTAVTAFLASYETLGKTGEALYAEYPPPAQALAQLQRRGGVVTAEDSARIREQGRRSGVFLAELTSSRVSRAVLSERQLDEVMVDFWENHFNVFSGKDRTRYYLPEFDTKVIRPHALGHFRELLGAVAKSEAMLYYLDNWQSVADSGRPVLQPARAPNRPQNPRAAARRTAAVQPRSAQVPPAAQRRRGLNENYARELMELHTLGVDGGYTQQDVIEVARALTGWTLDRGAQGGSFVFRPMVHDAGAKVILGQKFPAGRGIEEGEAVLDLLARHPQTATFIATKLARRFVSDTPPPALVARAAARFRATDGDIREVVRTIVTSPEFFSADAYRAKVKSPFELVVSTLRVMNATPDSTPRSAQLVSRLGQPIFGHQAPNGYPETGDAWMNTGAILNRINFGLSVASGRVPGVKLAAWPASKELASLPREQQVDGVIRELFGGAASTDTRQVLLTGTNPFLEKRGGESDTAFAMNGNAGNKRQSAASGFAQIVGLALGAPEFQRR